MRQPRFQVYEARDGWRWRLLAANGRTIADSGEAYTRKQDADRAVRLVVNLVIAGYNRQRMEPSKGWLGATIEPIEPRQN